MPATPAKALLSPDNHSLLMIDHQYPQMLTICSHDANELINHAVALVEAAAIFKVPMLTTTAFKERQGLVAPLAEATKAVKPIDRTTLNSWEDPRIVDWVEKTGRSPRSTLAMTFMSSQTPVAVRRAKRTTWR